MVKAKKIQKARIASLILFIGAAGLELSSLLIAFIAGHPYTNVCPPEVTIIPELCFYLSLSALIVAITAFFVSALSSKRNFVLFASLILVVVILCLAQVILHQSGFGLNWCNVHW